jgi:hypothetical protein
MRRSPWIPVGALAVLAAVSSPRAARADLAAGDVRTAASRDGVPMREKPRTLSKVLGVIPYGARVKVQDVESYFARVATEAGLEGWVREADLVEPTKLTGPGAYGPQGPTAAASSDLTAAGRQFDQKTEKTYRKMVGTLEKAYPLVDALENEPASESEVIAFASEGRLGPVESPESGRGPYARLRLQGSSGDGPVEVTAAESLPLLEPTPTSDAEFVERLGKEFSPEQEYWLGRSVAAAAIAEHGLDPDAKRQALVKKVGRAIAMLSDRIRTPYGGWHFAVLDDPTPNGLSAPGGFVFVTRGAVALARNEDELAGVLAHEMAHVANKHGESMIRRTREFQDRLAAMREKIIRPERAPDGCNLCADVARLLGQASADLVKTLDVEGYGREMELAADWDGSLYLCDVGYHSSAIAEYLELLPDREGARWTTHPTSEDRIEALRPIVFRSGCRADADAGVQLRTTRFLAVSGGKKTAAVPVPAPATPTR